METYLPQAEGKGHAQIRTSLHGRGSGGRGWGGGEREIINLLHKGGKSNNIIINCMYVNKRVELAQRGIALHKIYVLLLFIIITETPPCQTEGIAEQC